MFKVVIHENAAYKTSGDIPVKGGTADVLFILPEKLKEYNLIAVFKTAGTVRDVILSADEAGNYKAAIPTALLSVYGYELFCGIYAYKCNKDSGVKTDIIPTIWCSLGIIADGADPDGDDEDYPTASLYQRLEDKKADKEQLILHMQDEGNPHGVTAEQTGAYDKAAVDEKFFEKEFRHIILPEEFDSPAVISVYWAQHQPFPPKIGDMVTIEKQLSGGEDAHKTYMFTYSGFIPLYGEEIEAALSAHEEDTENPHGVTAEQTGAYDKATVDEKITAARTEAAERSGEISAALSAHEENTENPHGVTAEQTGAYDKAAVDEKITAARTEAAERSGEISAALSAHESDTENPHGVTAEQTGAYDKAAVDEKITAARTEAAELSGEIIAALSAHECDTNNPHWVTAEQTGAYDKATVDKKLDKVSGISKDAGKTSIDGTYFPGQKLCTANGSFSYKNAVSNSVGLDIDAPYNFNEEFNKTANTPYYGYIRVNKDICKLSANTAYIMFIKLTISNPSNDISKLTIRDLRRAYNGSETIGRFYYTGLKEGVNYVAVPFTVNTSYCIYGIYFDDNTDRTLTLTFNEVKVFPMLKGDPIPAFLGNTPLAFNAVNAAGYSYEVTKSITQDISDFELFRIAYEGYFYAAAYSGTASYGIAAYASCDEIREHIDNTQNPHGVTAEQTGAYDKVAVDFKLGEIKNTSLGGLTFSVAENGILTITKED